MKRERNLWHTKLADMIKICKNQGIKVVFVPNGKLRDYAGMNPEAADAMGYRMPAKTFYIDRNLSTEDKYETLKHELVEYNHMKEKGSSYWRAHCVALDGEGKA